MMLPSTASLLLAPVIFFNTISALVIAREAQPTHPQIYSKKLHSAKIFEALTTKKNLRTVTRTVDAAATIELADVYPALAHDARDVEAFATKKPWKTMTIEEDEVVYVTTTRKAAVAAVETNDVDLAARTAPTTAAVDTDDAGLQSTLSLHARNHSSIHETETKVKTFKHTTTTPFDSTATHIKTFKHTTTTPFDSTATHTKTFKHTTTTPVDSTATVEKTFLHTTTVPKDHTKTKTAGAKGDAGPTEPVQSIEWKPRWSKLLAPVSSAAVTSSPSPSPLHSHVWDAMLSNAAVDHLSHQSPDISSSHFEEEFEPVVVVESVTVTASANAAASATA